MQQRVAVARALAQNSSIIAFDEPFGALDVDNRSSLQHLLVEQAEVNNLTSLFITHDIEEAMLVSDRVVIMGRSPSKIVAHINTKGISLPYIESHETEFSRIKNTIISKLKAS